MGGSIPHSRSTERNQMNKTWVKPTINDEKVDVEFLQEWMGHFPGTHITLWKSAADQLKERGTVRFLNESSNEEEVSEEPKTFKSFKKPFRDKMVKNSYVDK